MVRHDNAYRYLLIKVTVTLGRPRCRLDGLDVVRRLEHQAQSLLKPGAELLLELDPRNLTVVRDFAKSWEYSQSYEDLAERKRFLLLTR